VLCPAVVVAAAAAADVKAAKVVQEPVYQLYPVLNENRWLWQFLHSLLMLLSFCFLLPLGSLLARHKWIFGRDELSVSAAGLFEGVLQCCLGLQCWRCAAVQQVFRWV
jgi:hypothetical protein